MFDPEFENRINSTMREMQNYKGKYWNLGFLAALAKYNLKLLPVERGFMGVPTNRICQAPQPADTGSGWQPSNIVAVADTVEYAGVGARDTPEPVLATMKLIAAMLGARGFTLRSGGAKGADSAFEAGADSVNGMKIIRTQTGWLPAIDHAAKFHPNWNACNQRARELHARNSLVMLRSNFDCPVNFLVCWTPGGEVVGGTGQALRIAAAYNIPVYNLAIDPIGAGFWNWLSELGL